MAKVLVIEDDVQQVLVASFALRRGGHRVHAAADGERGLQAAQALRPDVIICDVMMPGLSGFEVVASLRQISELAFTPVVLLTSMSEVAHMRQGMTSGADDYLTKPCTPEDLLRAVDAALARRGQQRQAVAGAISGAVGVAVEKEKQALALRYEVQLTREMGARWSHAVDDEGHIAYTTATIVYAQWRAMGLPASEPPHLAARKLRTAYQATRDTLYLFGAERVVSHPDAFVGLFSPAEGESEHQSAVRAARAAFALARSCGSEQLSAMGLQSGEVHAIAFHDPLHGETGYALVPGEALAGARALAEAASLQGWQVAASQALAQMLRSDVAQGASSRTEAGIEAVQLLPS